MDAATALPASTTKHLPILHHPLPTRDAVLSLRQRHGDDSEGTGTTGTTLWLGGQVLAAYLASLRPPANNAPTSGEHNPVALELGAGIGFLSLSLAAQGYDVLSTDIEPILSTVLGPNVTAARLPAGSGRVVVRELDWVGASAGGSLDLDFPPGAHATHGPRSGPQLDLLVMADTVYATHLVPDLWATIARICSACETYGSAETADSQGSNQDSTSPSSRAPKFFLAVERRDPRMVDSALEQGRQMGMELRRVAHGRVARAVEKAYGWKDGWEGVEVWKGRWRGGEA